MLHRAHEAGRGERLRRADRAVEAVGALLQPAEGRVQREPQRTGGRGVWRGRVFEPRASAHRFGVPRLHLWVRGRVCAARGVPRSSDSLSRKLENSRAQPYSHGRRLFMPCGRARASAAVPLGQMMPRAPVDTAVPSRAPRIAPFRTRSSPRRSRRSNAHDCARTARSRRAPQKPSVEYGTARRTRPARAAAVASSQSPCSCGLRRGSPQLDRATSASTCVAAKTRGGSRSRRCARKRPPRCLRAL